MRTWFPSEVDELGGVGLQKLLQEERGWEKNVVRVIERSWLWYQEGYEEDGSYFWRMVNRQVRRENTRGNLKKRHGTKIPP